MAGIPVFDAPSSEMFMRAAGVGQPSGWDIAGDMISNAANTFIQLKKQQKEEELKREMLKIQQEKNKVAMYNAQKNYEVELAKAKGENSKWEKSYNQKADELKQAREIADANRASREKIAGIQGQYGVERAKVRGSNTNKPAAKTPEEKLAEKIAEEKRQLERRTQISNTKLISELENYKKQFATEKNPALKDKIAERISDIQADIQSNNAVLQNYGGQSQQPTGTGKPALTVEIINQELAKRKNNPAIIQKYSVNGVLDENTLRSDIIKWLRTQYEF